MTKNFWDERYNQDEYAYGIHPNDFLKFATPHLKHNSKLLCIGEGEGRNANFLAGNGHDVVAIDQSKIGLDKAVKLAKQNGNKIDIIVSDINDFDMGIEKYDAIISIFFHLPSKERPKLYSNIKKSLKIGGVFIIEAYAPEQLGKNSGGPKEADLLVPLAEIENAFAGYDFIHKKSLAREVNEGLYHNGKAEVIQAIIRK